jgi:hypothetical protein
MLLHTNEYGINLIYKILLCSDLHVCLPIWLLCDHEQLFLVLKSICVYRCSIDLHSTFDISWYNGLEGLFMLHYIPECVEIMKMLQNVSQVVSVESQMLAKNIKVIIIYTSCNVISYLLQIFVS